MARLLVLVFGLSALSPLAPSGRASAQEALGCVDELTDAEVRSRIDWLDGRFQHGKTRARLWWYGQIALWLGVATFQTVLAFTSDEPLVPNAIAMTGAWLSFIQVTAIPHVAAFAPQRFRRLSEATDADRRVKLRQGLEWLERAAKRQRLARGAGAHIPVFLWSGGFGTFFSVRYRDWWLSTRMIVGGLLLSEFRILSTPQQARRDWDDARGMMCGARYVPRGAEEYPVLEDLDDGVEVSAYGLGLQIRW
ncbi:MAG: hypothetical protein KF901_19415 [Myxococcales bacterium]|nr:hypothetical protein [Myxococcales bacterium]